MVIVEINNNKGAFCFKRFKTKLEAQRFCINLPKKCSSLNAFIVRKIV